MKTIEQNDLMVHVEGIVRPVRATERRKLWMRRELFGHLQAALDEERERTQDEAAAWENAKRRLGVPAELTRSLQASVPWMERVILARLPVPGWMNRWEKRVGKASGTTGMTLGQQALFSLAAMAVIYGSIILLALRTQGQYRAEMMKGLSEQMWEFRVGTLLSAVLLVLIQGAGYAVMGAVSRQKRIAGVARRVLFLVAVTLVWQIDLITLIAQKGVHVSDVMWSVSVGIIAALSLAGLGWYITRLGRPYKPWLELELAS